MSAKYGWIITKDYLATSDLPHDPGFPSDKGTEGPHDAPFHTEQLKGGEKFRMLDDDGEVYYEGRIVGDYEGFEPLDDFGTPNAGCTTIEYKSPQGEWEQL